MWLAPVYLRPKRLCPAFFHCHASSGYSGQRSLNKLSGRLRGLKPYELKERLDSGDKDLMLLDVRTDKEITAVAKIPGSAHIPLDEIDQRLAELDFAKDKEVLIICPVGLRGYLSSLKLNINGFKHTMI